MPDYTILIVDYEPRSVEAARAPLAAAGYKVEVASDGVAGLEAFDRLNPDLVLIEAMLPKKHGFEVCQTIKNSPQGKRVPVLITTAVYKGRKYRTQALHIYGCDEYVEKPVAADHLVALCQRFLKGDGNAPGASSEPRVPLVMPPRAQPLGTRTTATPVGPDRIQREEKPPAGSPARRDSGTPRNAGPTAQIVADLTEEEIMARLDAILPDETAKLPSWGGAAAVPALEPAPTTEVVLQQTVPVSAIEPPPEARVEAAPADPEGSLPVAGTGAADSFMTSAPVENAAPSAPAEASRVVTGRHLAGEGPVASAAPDIATRTEEPHLGDGSQIVPFDVSRSRKRRVSRTSSAAATPVVPASHPVQAAAVEDRTHATAPSAMVPPPAAAARTQVRQVPEILPVPPTVTPKRGRRLIENPRKSGLPWWVWVVAVAAVALGAIYLLLGSSGRLATSTRPPAARQAEEPGPAASDAAASAPLAPIAVSTPLDGGRGEPARLPRNEAVQAGPKKAATVPTKGATPMAAARAPASETAAPQPIRPASGAVAAPKVSQPTQQSLDQAARPMALAAAATADSSKPPPAPPAGGSDTPGAGPPAPESASKAPAETPAQSTTTPPPLQSPSAAEAPPAPSAPERAGSAPPNGSVTPGDLVSFDDLDAPLAAISKAAPAYTPRARMLRQKGSVFLNVLVDQNGKVEDVQIIQGISNSDLNEAAVKAVRGWRYQPPVKKGVPVKVWKSEKINFVP